MGADHVVNSAEKDLAGEVRKLCGGIGADAVIDITGAGKAIINSLKSVRAGGKVVCVGLPTQEIPLDLTNDLIYREVELTGVSGRLIWKTWEDFSAVMRGPYFKPDLIMGQRFAMKDFDKAAALIRSGHTGKMIIYP